MDFAKEISYINHTSTGILMEITHLHKEANPCPLPQGAFHALRPEDLRRGVSFLVGVAASI